MNERLIILSVIACTISIITCFAVVVVVGNRLDDTEMNITRYVGDIVCEILRIRENRPDKEPVSLYQLKEMYRAENREQHAELERLSKENERLKKLLKNYQERVVYSGFCQGCKHIDETTPCKECSTDNYLWEYKE